jgi:hypothetical protein
MCIEVVRTMTTRRDITAYKTVRRIKQGTNKGAFRSGVALDGRVTQDGHGVGKVLVYAPHKVVKSPFDKTAGIYCFTNEVRAYNNAQFDYPPRPIIKVVIPKGTRIHLPSAALRDCDVVCAEKVRVVGEVKPRS